MPVSEPDQPLVPPPALHRIAAPASAPLWSPAATAGAADRRCSRRLAWVRVAFGVFFAVNLGFHFSPEYAARFALDVTHAATAAGQPQWLGAWAASVLGAMRAVGMNAALAAMFGLEALLTVALLTGWGFPVLGWVGLGYELLLWSTVGGLGGPYVAGATDPGTAIVYALGFAFVLLLRAWQGTAWAESKPRPPQALRVRLAYWLFGLLWAFDAWCKWQPGFLDQAGSLLASAQAGQPGWIVDWIGWFVGLAHVVGTRRFAILIALAETAIAAGLLLAPRLPAAWIRLTLLGGLGYSLLVWTTAEGFGGPYGPGFTGNRGDVLGTTTVYALLFAFLLAARPWLAADAAPAAPKAAAD